MAPRSMALLLRITVIPTLVMGVPVVTEVTGAAIAPDVQKEKLTSSLRNCVKRNPGSLKRTA